MNFLVRACGFMILMAIIFPSVTVRAGSLDVEKVPVFSEHVTLTGEQVDALLVAIKELRKEKLGPAGDLVTVHQSDGVFVVIFDSPAKLMTERGAAGVGPPGFEVTVARPSMRVIKAHFMR